MVEPRPRTGAETIGHEYGVGSFHRRFEIDETIDTEAVTAEFRHGKGHQTFHVQGAVPAPSRSRGNAPAATTMTFKSDFGLVTERQIIFHYRNTQGEEGVAIADYAGAGLEELIFQFKDFARNNKDQHEVGVLRFKRLPVE